jgi:Kef-type K+ transport system membrane component KefB
MTVMKSAREIEGSNLKIILAYVLMIGGVSIAFLFRAIHQPPVIGEIIGKIVLNPSVLGRFDSGLAS